MVNVQYTYVYATTPRGHMQTQIQVRTDLSVNDNAAAISDELFLDTAGLRQAREFARLVTGTRDAGDRLLSRSMEWVRLQYRHRQFSSGCFTPLVHAMRMIVRTGETDPGPEPAAVPKAVQSHLSLPLEAREAAALHIILEGDCPQVSAMLCLPPGAVQELLDQSWGSRLVLLACTSRAS